MSRGTVHLVGTDYDKIMNEVSTLLDDAAAYERMSKAVNPYGDGKACRRITAILANKEFLLIRTQFRFYGSHKSI